MRETLMSILLIGLLLGAPLGLGLAFAIGNDAHFMAIDVHDREHIPYYDEEAYAD